MATFGLIYLIGAVVFMLILMSRTEPGEKQPWGFIIGGALVWWIPALFWLSWKVMQLCILMLIGIEVGSDYVGEWFERFTSRGKEQ